MNQVYIRQRRANATNDTPSVEAQLVYNFCTQPLVSQNYFINQLSLTLALGVEDESDDEPRTLLATRPCSLFFRAEESYP